MFCSNKYHVTFKLLQSASSKSQFQNIVKTLSKHILKNLLTIYLQLMGHFMKKQSDAIPYFVSSATGKGPDAFTNLSTRLKLNFSQSKITSNLRCDLTYIVNIFILL